MTEAAFEPQFELPDEDEGGFVPFMQTKFAADLWLDELNRRGRSPRTINSYRRHLYRLSDYLGPTVGVREVTTEQLRRYLDHTAANARPWGAGKLKGPGTRAIEVTVLNNFFDWLSGEQMIKGNPTRRNSMRILTRPRQQRPEDNDTIVSVSTNDVRKMLNACRDWDEKLCLYTLAYLGPRRHAIAQVKIQDYDEAGKPPTIAFREKGHKTIAKPVPPPLARIIDGARAAGVYAEQDWLIPNRKPGQAGAVWLPSVNRPERDDALIYRIVKLIAARVGINSHVHALRAAFAVYFLEAGGDKYDLQLLMGHASGATTDIYARRLDKKKRMQSVLNLNWEAKA